MNDNQNTHQCDGFDYATNGICGRPAVYIVGTHGYDRGLYFYLRCERHLPLDAKTSSEVIVGRIINEIQT